ncbi:MAG: TIGR04053 family radical SAM/SPASM domain-containing protein [Deltaproteobacteria bacterium]|nr:TIGR04053 family radical SAM/SPASM domain-containing protein [Deltaproteobacteria bacterium]
MRPSMVDFAKAPFLVIWETTQACDLQCHHCRASAQPLRHPGELTTEEGKRLLSDTAAMGTPVFILSGGDPAKRPDLHELIRHGKQVGLRMGTIPAATATLSEDLVKRLKDDGLDQMASVDGPRPERHDELRGVPGAFAKTMQAIEWAHRAQLPLQINTTLCGRALPYFSEMTELVSRLGIVFWEVFFLVPVGRGEGLGGLTPEQCEDLFAILYDVQKRSDFVLKVTEAPHYRRYVAQHEAAAEGGGNGQTLPKLLQRSEGPGHTVGLAPRGVNAGNGFAFVSHTGEVYPSGFLPILAGSLRAQGIAEIYRDSEVFRTLRDPSRLLGRCGRCEYAAICGGSRSRAFALTGNYLATDPWCGYDPPRRSTTLVSGQISGG